MRYSIITLALLLGTNSAPGQTALWTLDQLDLIGGHQPIVVGAPRLIESPRGQAIQFDGQADGLFVDANPLTGLTQFTAEVIFQPAADGPKEQRFVHFQETGTDNRLLFEIRLLAGNQWFLDTFIKSGDGNYTQLAEKFPHPIGPWYHAAVVMDGKAMRHYVNGAEELSTPIAFKPHGPGQTSIGVRFNKVSWYKGAVRQIRVTPQALLPHDFLKP